MSNFTDKVLVSDASEPPSDWSRILIPPGFRTPLWRLERDLIYRVGSLEAPRETIVTQKGFDFDGHSVPLSIVPLPLLVPLMWLLFLWDVPWQGLAALALLSFGPRVLFPRSHPEYMAAAALHDWLYTRYDDPRSRSEADAIFREALNVLGTGKIWRTLMWLAVRAGGWVYWYPPRLGQSSWEIALKWFFAFSAPGAYQARRQSDDETGKS